MKRLITTLMGGSLNTLSVLAPKAAGKLGVKMFCYPFRTALKPYHHEFLNSSAKFEFHFQGLRLQAYRWGRGEKKVLFLHGWQSHSFRWKNYIQSLSPDEFTVYAFDAPAHGFSTGNFLSVPFYSEAIQDFVAHVGPIDTAIGHSVGSFSLVYTLYRIPLLPVNKIVLMAPPGEANDFISAMRQTLKLSDKAVQLAIKQFEERFGYSIQYFSAPKFAASLTVPGIIIHDQQDLETPYHYAKQINDAWKNSSLITTNGLGHNLKSADVVRIVNEYITGQLQPELAKM